MSLIGIRKTYHSSHLTLLFISNFCTHITTRQLSALSHGLTQRSTGRWINMCQLCWRACIWGTIERSLLSGQLTCNNNQCHLTLLNFGFGNPHFILSSSRVSAFFFHSGRIVICNACQQSS